MQALRIGGAVKIYRTMAATATESKIITPLPTFAQGISGQGISMRFVRSWCIRSLPPNDSGQRTGATGSQHGMQSSPPGSLRRDGWAMVSCVLGPQHCCSSYYPPPVCFLKSPDVLVLLFERLWAPMASLCAGRKMGRLLAHRLEYLEILVIPCMQPLSKHLRLP
jgi:hypothetical protein